VILDTGKTKMSFIIIFAPKTWQGIRALSIDKDNAPKWSPATLEEVKNEDIDRLFEPFSSEKELQVPSDDSNRWSGKFEHTVYGRTSE
jgi:3-hydroxyisobutyryl-CoA hydrolase